MNWDPQKPYNDLPPLPPIADVESREILKETIEARASLASLDQAVQRIPNPSILINSLSILEAQASSEIENIVTTSDDLFRNVQREALSDRLVRRLGEHQEQAAVHEHCCADLLDHP